MKKYLFFTLLFIGSFHLRGQQQPQFSRGLDNYYLMNPAAWDSFYYILDTDMTLNVNVYSKTQWIGKNIEGVPISAGASAYSTFNEQFLVGGGLFYDQWGSLKNYYGNFRCAFDLIKGSEKQYSSISIGTSIHLEGLSLDTRKISFTNQRDKLIYDNDLLNSKPFFRAAFGFFGHTTFGDTKVMGGIAASNIFNTSLGKEFDKLFNPESLIIVNGGVVPSLGKNIKLEINGSLSWVKNSPKYITAHMRFYHELDNGMLNMLNDSYLSYGIGYDRNSWIIEASIAFLLANNNKNYWSNNNYLRVGFIWNAFNKQSYGSLFGRSNTIELRFSFLIN